MAVAYWTDTRTGTSFEAIGFIVQELALAAFYALAGLRLMKCITSNTTPAIRAT
jgi:hypothetical protein